jgi:hypothetical protein
MDIPDRPPGLLSRRAFYVDRDRVVVEERWDIAVPGCPMIRNPWLQPMQVSGSLYVRQVEMTADEYNHSKPVLFET